MRLCSLGSAYGLCARGGGHLAESVCQTRARSDRSVSPSLMRAKRAKGYVEVVLCSLDSLCSQFQVGKRHTEEALCSHSSLCSQSTVSVAISLMGKEELRSADFPRELCSNRSLKGFQRLAVGLAQRVAQVAGKPTTGPAQARVETYGERPAVLRGASSSFADPR
jgi:hypothetical protein